MSYRPNMTFSNSQISLYFLFDPRTGLYSNGDLSSHSWSLKGKSWLSLGSLSTYLESLILKCSDSSFTEWEVVEYRLSGGNEEVRSVKSRFPALQLLLLQREE